MDRKQVYFVGAGPGAADLITVRGRDLIGQADVIIYAGSLVNPDLLGYAKQGADIHNSAYMTLEEVLSVMEQSAAEGKMVVRLHTGDPSLYGAVREQMDALDERGITYESCPGISAAFGAAASMDLEYTLPGLSQSLIITRMEGRTPVPEKESIESWAAHGATMAIYLSTGMLGELSRRLVSGGYSEDTPAAIIYKATWPEEEYYYCTVSELEKTAADHGITKTALILVGDVIGKSGYEKSKLYDKTFTTEFRKGQLEGTADLGITGGCSPHFDAVEAEECAEKAGNQSRQAEQMDDQNQPATTSWKEMVHINVQSTNAQRFGGRGKPVSRSARVTGYSSQRCIGSFARSSARTSRESCHCARAWLRRGNRCARTSGARSRTSRGNT